ncbi:MAG: pseudouridine synthase [bacterium]|nr:pseudouridine synthase [bacterium]
MKKPVKKQKPLVNVTPNYPMRINKYLALKRITTRRGADELVEKKKVFINGKLAVLGSKVLEKDTVEVRQKKGEEKKYVYYAYNKPTGVETNSPRPDLFPLGRLDKASHGLLILTNDGRITDQLLNPKYVHEKEYVVKTKEKLRNNFKEKMEAGVQIEDYKTKPCKVTIVNENTFRVTLTEGKKHQIRRMCVALFQEVQDLKRVRVMNIELGKLALKGVREIKGEELSTFLGQILQ